MTHRLLLQTGRPPVVDGPQGPLTHITVQFQVGLLMMWHSGLVMTWHITVQFQVGLVMTWHSLRLLVVLSWFGGGSGGWLVEPVAIMHNAAALSPHARALP